MANRMHVFIDASNIWQAQKSKGMGFDYAKLKDYLTKKFSSEETIVFYYTAYPKPETRSYSTDPKHKFFTYLSKSLKFRVVKKPLKQISEDDGTIMEKGNLDVEMTIDVIHNIKNYETAIFFTGDSDFLPLITYIRNRGKRAYVFSSKNNISNELRTGADGYFEILDIKDDIWRTDLRHRPNK
jgi:uncharacterized LabA/DUF88 family protein